MKSFILLGILATLCILQSETATPPIRGGALQYSVDVEFLYDVPKMTWNFTYYYDWNHKA